MSKEKKPGLSWELADSICQEFKREADEMVDFLEDYFTGKPPLSALAASGGTSLSLARFLYQMSADNELGWEIADEVISTLIEDLQRIQTEERAIHKGKSGNA